MSEPIEPKPWTVSGRDAGSRPFPIPSATHSVRTNQVVDVGVELCADLYVPDGTGPFPAIVEVTPYGAQRLSKIGRMYAARGYLFAAVDCRGRYRSAGTWEPLSSDTADGLAIIAWLASHELCNGDVGTRGASYSGFNQLLTAIEAPPALRAMCVVVAPGDPFENVPYQGGAYDLNDLFWLLDVTGRVCLAADDEGGGDGEEDDEADGDDDDDDDDDEDSPVEREQDALTDQALTARPFRELDLRLGVRHDVFRTWVDHWQLDDYWQRRSVMPRIGRIAVPALFVSGWWDGNGRGATAFYRALRGGPGTDSVRDGQRLLMGPWDHDLTAPDCDDLPKHEAKAVERGAGRDYLNDELAFFDLHLGGFEPGPSFGDRVQLFVTGVNRWLGFDEWPPAGAVRELLLAGGADRRSGTLGPTGSTTTGSTTTGSTTTGSTTTGSATTTYTCKTTDPTPFAPEHVDAERIPFDQAGLHRERDDYALFDSAAQSVPLALIGEVELIVYAACDRPDFDLCVKLLDVYPGGRAIYLTDGVLRARFRGGYENPVLVDPGVRNEYRIDLWHLAHVLRPGHRLRVEVASAAFLRFDVNPCTGGDLATDTEGLDATVTLHHDAEHPSRLILPVCEDSRLCGGDA